MNDRSMLGHEISRIPSRSSVVTLTNIDARPKDGHHSTKVHDRFGLLRHFRLQFFAFVVSLSAKTSWNAETEYRKVAIHHNRAVATSHSLLHLVPLTGAIILLLFQWTNYLVDYWNDYSTGLQFAAKIHELAMQASLIETLLCLIRKSLVENMVPLGALTCVMQTTQLSYLWSMDFFSIFRSRALGGWRRMVLIVAIPVIVCLISIVGPSSAVLMIPRPNSPKASKLTLYANLSANLVYPSHIALDQAPKLILRTVEDCLQLDEEYGNKTAYTSFWGTDTIQNTKAWLLSGDNYSKIGTKKSMKIYRDHNLSYKDRIMEYTCGLGKHGCVEINATLPTLSSGRLLGFSSGIYNSNATREVKTPHAVVSVRCLESEDIHMGSNLRYQKDDGKTKDELSDLDTILERVSDIKVASSNITDGTATMILGPVYIPSPELGSSSTIFVLFGQYEAKMNATAMSQKELLPQVLAQLRSTPKERRLGLGVQVCTISSYWNKGTTMMTDSAAVLTLKESKSLSDTVVDPQQITLDFSGAATLWSAAFTKLLISDSYWRMTYLPVALASMLSVVSPYNESIVYNPKPYSNDSHPYDCTITKYGYGYGTRSTSIYLAITVITLYCAITTTYVLYCIITGTASTAWSSGIELFTLALQSRRPDHLGHTSVGIDSIKTFSEGVGIRVNQDDELEIVFANDRDFGTRGLKRVDRNKEY